MCCRRIIHQFPVAHLFLIESFIVLYSRCLDTVMIRMIGLDHSLPRLFSSSASSHCLAQKLKSPFPASVIIRIQGKICSDHSHQGHIREIMSFYDHLGSDQNICFMSGKRRQDLLITSLVSGSVKIHSQGSHSWKCVLHYFLNLLGTGFKSADIR